MDGNSTGSLAELQHPLNRGLISLTFWTHCGRFLSNFPVEFQQISACVWADCDADLDETAKRCNITMQLITNFFQNLFGTE
jgi:hypothetical protein